MSRAGPETSKRLQFDPTCIRNICILAHVDHGKTSLSDSLLASNGIISQKLAGRVRYLDSRPDEQLRGITMESSAISLYFRVLHNQEGSDQPLVNEHLINLIDSPGHIDFSSEVSAASRLCDGAVVLVDVVEGVCSQTVTVLRQCWTEKLKPILVLNKIDRLITELQLTAQEAYLHLSKVIEQVNSVIGSFYAGEKSFDDESWRERLEHNVDAEYVERDDSDLYFNPMHNNVVFASAVDGWGFNIGRFAKFYQEKLGAKRENLQKVLWGDFYMDPKTKKIINQKGLKGRNLKPLFVTLILDNIWKIYDNVLNQHDSEVLTKITNTLKITIQPRDLRSKDYKNLLRTIMGQWVPVSTAILLSVVEKIPSPVVSQNERIDTLLGNSVGHESADLAIVEGMKSCDKHAPLCAYVSKMLSIPKEELPLQTAGGPLSADAVIARSRKAREEAMKAAKYAEMVESMKKLKPIQDEDQKQTNDDVFERVLDSTITPDVDVIKANAVKSKQLARNTENDQISVVTEAAPKFDLGIDFEYEDDENELSENDISEPQGGLVEFVPEIIDANDPLASMFEYEEEDPFSLEQQDTKDFDVDAESVEELDVEDSNEVLIGFTRLYSGTLKVGQQITILGPKYNPANPTEHIETAEVTCLYLFMGRDLVPLEECPAGNIVGVGGLAGKLLKNGTLIQPGVSGINLAGMNFHSQPIVRVALEPANPTHMNRLVHGLKLLNQADPCVETYVTDNGEHILCTAGELHLERCLKDLKERFAGIDITSSEPVIPYKETFISVPEMNPVKNSDLGRGYAEGFLAQYRLKFRALPLPPIVIKFLLDNEQQLEELTDKEVDLACKNEEKSIFLGQLKLAFEHHLENNVLSEWKDVYEKYINEIAAFGPNFSGPNLLIDVSGSVRKFDGRAGKFEYEYSLINGFQLSVREGPLAKEPVQGMCVVLEEISEMTEEEMEKVDEEGYQRSIPNFSGRLITKTRDLVHESMMEWSPRLMWAMYTCDIQASVEVLGKVYAVVLQRRGKITSEEMKEGTPFFQIEARIPVVEAFGFSEDIRKKTSGAAQPQLVFAGFEIIDLDPFWVPNTEEELEEMGEFADKENVARRHMNTIRRKKGLFIDEKVIQNAEKQRTLKRN
ncbi:unnamed protein product [Kluyveromyces dobzhanskii CBS 2104]|uniref:Ribosome assembly protein 1 n=1 Tax=Kluyveromyces dobzhanskii CBS 2104 TaxID=1427455 RepID=A0A0A8L679_9SACH|nr:unnamed protein product [Kluyveromyces dobzhanskii CBS 2104]